MQLVIHTIHVWRQVRQAIQSVRRQRVTFYPGNSLRDRLHHIFEATRRPVVLRNLLYQYELCTYPHGSVLRADPDTLFFELGFRVRYEAPLKRSAWKKTRQTSLCRSRVHIPQIRFR